MSLPPHKLIQSPTEWEACLSALQSQPRLALDLEANSMYAYRESVCLIQISIPEQDFIIDPTSPVDLSGLGELLASTAVEKIFHAAEYDLILLKRQYEWQVNNLFDTMWAARILGYAQYGLANILHQFYQVTLDKQYQKSNWCKRPLTPAQLNYAQYDTHFLLRLRDDLAQQLQAANRQEEAYETFFQQSQIIPPPHEFDPDSFWSIAGVNELKPIQQAILRELHIYRDQEARRRNQPPFKILGDRSLIELAQLMPASIHDLHRSYGMTDGQVHRYGDGILHAVAQARHSPLPRPPRRHRRTPEAVLLRYEKLHTWRKRRAQARGVESDVILGREVLWDIARHNPTTTADLQGIPSLGDWRRQAYGSEIVELLRQDDL